MVTTVGTYAIEPFDLAGISEEDLWQIADLQNALAHERVPEDPIAQRQVVIDRMRARPKMVQFAEWLARTENGEIAGTAALIRFESDTNQHLRETALGVLRRHRRRGLARRFLAEMLQAAGQDDLVLDFSTNDRVPAGEAFVRRIGAKETLRARMSQLALGDLDRNLTRAWARIDPAGYRLAWIDDDVPERLMASVIAAYEAMNTAPRGASAMEDWHVTPEQVREFDRSRRGARRLRRLVLALDDRTGETAGYTEVIYDPRVPHVVHQQGTAVIPAYRGRGLGKWVKAAMLERVVDEWPEARFVRTGNATVNAPMLGINTRLGFKHAWDTAHWEATVADLRRYVGPP